jgi:tetratricopeptide (TPR) repeat protein
VLLMMGRFAEALSDLDRATAMKGTPHEVVAAYGLEPRATALAWNSWIHWFHGNAAAARESSARAIALARESDNPLTLAFCLGVAGASLHSLLGEPEESLRLADEVDVLASEHGLAFYSAGVQLYRGHAHLLQGFYARSIEEIEAGLARWRAAGTVAYRGFFLSLVAVAHHHLGRAAEAMRYAEEAIQHVETTGERLFESEIRRHFALLLEAAGDSKRAKAELGRAIKVARQQGASVFLQRAIASLAASRQRRIRSRSRASGTAEA